MRSTEEKSCILKEIDIKSCSKKNMTSSPLHSTYDVADICGNSSSILLPWSNSGEENSEGITKKLILGTLSYRINARRHPCRMPGIGKTMPSLRCQSLEGEMVILNPNGYIKSLGFKWT